MRKTLDIKLDLISPCKFWSSTKKNDLTSCLEWQGARDIKGYGRIQKNGHFYLAHRFALVLTGASLIAGTVVDHLCRNPSCVNPVHLEQVSHQTNTVRGASRVAASMRARERGECINGHILATVGTHVQRGGVTCAQCGRDRVRRYTERKAAA